MGIFYRMKISNMLRTFVIFFLFAAVSSIANAAVGELNVYIPVSDVIISYNTSEMYFEATVGNAGDYGSSPNFAMEITNPNGGVRSAQAVERSTGHWIIPYALDTVSGKHQLRFYANGALVSPAVGTISEITVRFQVRDVGITESVLKRDMEDVWISGYLLDRNGNPLKYTPSFRLEGADIGSTNYAGDGYFNIRVNRITTAGPRAVKLFADGAEVAAWSVASQNFTGLWISPGGAYAGFPQGLSVRAYTYSSSFQAIELDSSNLRVEISGIPVLADSVPSYIEREYESGSTERLFRVVVSGDALRNGRIQFESTGIATLLISTDNYSYQRTIELPVYSLSDADIIGAPNLRNFVSDDMMELSLRLPSGQRATQLDVELTVGDSDPVHYNASGISLDKFPAFEVMPMGVGTIQVQAKALVIDSQNKETTRQFTRSFPYALPTVSVEPQSIPLGDEDSVIVTLQDKDGNFVDNAYVTIERMGSQNGSNGGSGEYVFNGKWTTPGWYRLTAISASGELLVDTTKLIYVQAPQVLRIQPEQEVLVAGLDQVLRVQLFDENGASLNTARVTAQIDGVGERVTMNAAGSGFYSLRVNPWHKVVVFAETNDGRRAAEPVEIEARYPEVDISISAVTLRFKDHVAFSFKHPLTGEVLTGEIRVRSENLEIIQRNAKSNGKTTREGSEFSFDMYSRQPNTNLESRLLIDFIYNGRDYNNIVSLPVGDAVIEFTPAQVQQNSTVNVDVRVLNASYQALEGIKVTAASQANVVQTNADGVAMFRNVSTGSRESVSFTIEREDALVVGGSSNTKMQVELPTVVDRTKPVVKVVGLSADSINEVTASTLKLEFELSDDYGLGSITVRNDQRPLAGKTATWSTTLELAPGLTTIPVRVADASNNVTELSIRVRYTAPTPPAPPVSDNIVMSIGSFVVRRGNTVLEQPPVAPQIIGGRTMLPFRYLCQTVMQGTVDYAADTRIIRTTVNGHDIVMQVDSPEITVDGEPITLDQAPTLVGDHTLVPVRAFQLVVADLQWNAVTQTVTIIP